MVSDVGGPPGQYCVEYRGLRMFGPDQQGRDLLGPCSVGLISVGKQKFVENATDRG